MEEDEERASRTSTLARAGAGLLGVSERGSRESTATRMETSCASILPLLSCASFVCIEWDADPVFLPPVNRVIKERPRGKATPATMEAKK